MDLTRCGLAYLSLHHVSRKEGRKKERKERPPKVAATLYYSPAGGVEIEVLRKR